MNYFEYLNKVLQNNTLVSSKIEQNENNSGITTNSDSTTVNLDGVPIFNMASKEEVNQIRYENILAGQKPERTK